MAGSKHGDPIWDEPSVDSEEDTLKPWGAQAYGAGAMKIPAFIWRPRMDTNRIVYDPTFQQLRTANVIREQEWDPNNSITLEFRGNELAGEVGEACNVIKKLARERLGIRGSRGTKEQLAEELADVIICADLIAMHAGIDLAAAVREKFNTTSEKYGLRARMA